MIGFRSTLIRYFSVLAGIALVTVAFLSLPAFESARTSITAPFNLNGTHLALAVLVVVALLFAGIYLRLIRTVVEPVETLVRQAETNRLKETFAKESSVIEFVRLRFVLESQSQNIRDMEASLAEIESKWEWADERLEKAKEHNETKDKEIIQKNVLLDDLRNALKNLEAKNVELADQLEEEGKRNIEVEVDRRSDEIYEQMRKAVQESAFSSLWLPRFIQELTAGTKSIQRIADQLKSTWTDSSLSRMYEDITEISRQSAEQIALLKSYESGEQMLVKQLGSGESMADLLRRVTEEAEAKFPLLSFVSDASESITSVSHSERIQGLLGSLIEKTAQSLREGVVSLTATISDENNISIRVSSKGILQSDQKIDLQEAQGMATSLNGAIYVDTDAEGAESVVITYPAGERPVAANSENEEDDEQDLEELAQQRFSSNPAETEV